MIIGVGIDLCDVVFWKTVLGDPTTSVVEGTFTTAEQADCRQGPVPPEERFAARFAAKEAAIKALAGARFGLSSMVPKIEPIDVEILRDQWGRPRIQLHGTANEIAMKLGVCSIHLSMSHEADQAAAVVILEADLKQLEGPKSLNRGWKKRNEQMKKVPGEPEYVWKGSGQKIEP